jgi:peptidyl-prolyl cis-trans isomerase C
MLKNALVFLMLLSVSLSTWAADPKLPKGVVAVVNGVNISQSLMDINVKINVERGQKDGPELRKIILDELIARELFAQESLKLGLDKTPQAQEQFALIRQNFLVDLLVNDYLAKNDVKEEEIRAEYDRQISAIGDPATALEYSVRHIIVAKEVDAKKIIASLKKGESFEKLAKEKSLDQNKDRGGLVGWLLPNQMPPALANVIMNLNKEGFTQAPLQTNVGWIIIKVDDIRPYTIPSYEDSKNQIKLALLQAKKAEPLKKLKETAKIIQ